ncbi:MAG: glycine zipper 2TM domain-containing protein [Magnetospirillum sp.]|nr:glycine zipper 2TM domain-containing protein [Magnetospirillum sp.]
MRKGLFIAAALVLGLSACAQPGGNGFGISKSTGGAILGGAGGALAGSQFGGGKGKLATTALGTLLGAWIGSEAGASMDRADQNYYSNQQRGTAPPAYGYGQPSYGYAQPAPVYRPQPQIQWNDPRGYDSMPPRY